MVALRMTAIALGIVMSTLLWMFLMNLGLRWTGEPDSRLVVAGVGLITVLMGAAIGVLTGPVSRLYHAVGSRLGLALVFGAALVTANCTTVNPGYVGIQVNKFGTDRGVESYPRVTGMVLYNPMSTTVFEYPTFVQTAKWTKNPHEGSENNEEISFTNADGMSIFADISLSYHLVPDKVPAFYVKFRNDDITLFTHGFLRNIARDTFDTHGGKYSIDQIMGNNAPFLADVRKDLQAALTPLGVQLDQLGFIGSPRPPQAVIDAINAKVHATQLTIQKQNELFQAQADAAKEVARTEGYAKSVTIRAEAEAAANNKMAASLTPTLIQYKQLEKWDGKLPQVSGGSTPFINLKP